MFPDYQKITIIHTRKPSSTDINEELQWFGTSLGLFNLRDKDRSCFRIFIEIIKYSRMKKSVSSDELAERLGLSRGTIVHHLNKLMESGIVVSTRNKYALRVENLSFLVDEIEKDLKRILGDLKEAGKQLDTRLGL